MSKIKSLTLMMVVAVLGTGAIASAAGSPAQDAPVPKDVLRGNAVAHGPIGVRPSTPVALKVRSERARAHKADLKAKAKAKRAAKTKAAAAPAGAVGGVSQSTLDAIAACESGGDPTAVNAGGYYGKYQFDTGTWVSVGGSGNPAAAPESEQDYRASLLYQQAGSSPWPVCGQ